MEFDLVPLCTTSHQQKKLHLVPPNRIYYKTALQDLCGAGARLKTTRAVGERH